VGKELSGNRIDNYYWAKLRELKPDNNTLLLRTNMEISHGGTTGRFKVYE